MCRGRANVDTVQCWWGFRCLNPHPSREFRAEQWAAVKFTAQLPNEEPTAPMNRRHFLKNFAARVATLGLAVALPAAESATGENLADHLPPHIRQVTWSGGRDDWSLDGKRILFLSKTFGDAMELEVDTMRIRNRTVHYPHHGYMRLLYLTNGVLLLSGPEQFGPRKAGSPRFNWRSQPKPRVSHTASLCST